MQLILASTNWGILLCFWAVFEVWSDMPPRSLPMLMYVACDRLFSGCVPRMFMVKSGTASAGVVTVSKGSTLIVSELSPAFIALNPRT